MWLEAGSEQRSPAARFAKSTQPSNPPPLNIEISPLVVHLNCATSPGHNYYVLVLDWISWREELSRVQLGLHSGLGLGLGLVYKSDITYSVVLLGWTGLTLYSLFMVLQQFKMFSIQLSKSKSSLLKWSIKFRCV